MLDPASNLLVESVLHGAGTMLVGDPQVLAQLELPADEGILPTPAGNAVVISAKSSVFVWVAGSVEIASLTVATSLDSPDREPTLIGHVDCPSGRIVVGTVEAVAAWGDEIEPDGDLIAQARAYRPDRRHCGHIIVARVLSGPHRVLGIAGHERLDGVMVDCISSAHTAGIGELLVAS